MPTNEAGVVASIVKAVRKEWPSAWIFKTVGNPWQMPGVPDLLFCTEGAFIGLEVKFQRPGESDAAARGRATQQQQHHIKKINKAGGKAAVVLSAEEALRVIRVAVEERNNGAQHH